MNAIEAAAYRWIKARERALKARCTFDAKGGVFDSTDPEAWVELGRAELQLHTVAKEWLGGGRG